jgi:hypothetical protein
MASSMLSPPTRADMLSFMPPIEITPTSVVPPPMSTIIEPTGSVTGKSAPIAAAMGSSISQTFRAPALEAASRIARRSTWVDPEGTQMTISGPSRMIHCWPSALRMKCLIICSATSRSEITPFRRGRMVRMFSGVLPIIILASLPTASTLSIPLMVSMATTEGSAKTTPIPLTYTTVFAVPRSIAKPSDVSGKRLRSDI